MAVQQGSRRGRWLVLAGLLAVLAVMIVIVVELSTQEPERGKARIAGIGDAQQTFGGVRQEGDRIGSPTPRSRSSSSTTSLRQLPGAVPDHDPPARRGLRAAGDAKLEYRHYSFTERVTQPASWRRRRRPTRTTLALHLPLLSQPGRGRAPRHRRRLPGRRSRARSPSSRSPNGATICAPRAGPTARSASASTDTRPLARDLEIRAEPATIVNGPAGTRTLQDTPSLDQITNAIEAVG